MTSRIYNSPAVLELTVEKANKDFSAYINESSFRIEVKPSDELLALFDKYDFTRSGRGTWSRHVRDETVRGISRFFTEYAQTFTPHTLLGNETMTKDHWVNEHLTDNLTNLAQTRLDQEINGGLSMVMRKLNEAYPGFTENQYTTGEVEVKPDYVHMMNEELSRVRDYYIANIGGRWQFNIEHKSIFLDHASKNVHEQFSPGLLVATVKNNTLWIRLMPTTAIRGGMEDEIYEPIRLMEGLVDGPQSKSPTYINHAQVSYARRTLETTFFTENVWNTASAEALAILDDVKGKYTVGYLSGRPATAFAYRGSDAPEFEGIEIEPGQASEVSLKNIISSIAKDKSREDLFIIHPSLFDMVSMNRAVPYDDENLRPYQQIAVGLHLSTQYGYLNASEPGLGKSIMQLTGMMARSQDIDYYRGIIVAEANVRQQWAEYAETWFPNAEVCVLTKANQKDALVQALGSQKPLIVILSYSLAAKVEDEKEKRAERAESLLTMTDEEKLDFFTEVSSSEVTIAELLMDTHWNDICADEAVCIRNGSSKQNRAMWTLRENSDVAVALTGTPVNKSPDDMARLLEWVRNDKKLFAGHKLSETYDTETLEGATELFNNLSPLVFRRERSEVQQEDMGKHKIVLPKMKDPVSIMLRPSPAEKALAHAAEKELKRVYHELLSALDAVEENGGADKDALAEAKAALRDARGQWLGGTQLARMATSDPGAIQTSESVGASLLVGQGFVANALENEPTKRTEFIKRAEKHIKDGKNILVFTEFAGVAESLVTALEENGIRAGAFTGKNLAQRERNRLAFQEGELDVLVCTKAGERGLTLHKAAAVYHYDLPWTPERIIQRVGRAIRLGSENPSVEVFFMILEDTVEERVAKQVLSQGISASMILDASRGLDVSKTELGATMAGLMGASKSLASKKGALEFGKALNLI